MAYTITASDGTINFAIADGTADGPGQTTTHTNLVLPGPNYVGYGQQLNNNLINLLTNFASNSAPSSVNVIGQLWYNKSSQTLNVFTENGYSPVSGVQIASISPTVVKNGDLWYNTNTGQISVYVSGTWQLIGPQYTKQQGISGAVATTIGDANFSNVTHNIVQIQFGNEIIAIFADTAFSPSPAIPGFPILAAGLTVNNTFTGLGFAQTQDLYLTNANVAAANAVIAGLVSTTSVLQTNVATLQSQVYSNANVTAYLSSNLSANPVITAINANVTGANSAIVTANTALKSYVDSQILANKYGNTNVATYLPTDPTIQSIVISNYNQDGNISSINANLTAANAAIVSTNSNVTTINNTLTNSINGANAAITLINANVTSVRSSITGANASIATLQSQVYSNANASSYLSTFNGNISTGNLTVQSAIRSPNYLFANGVSIASVVPVYSNANVASYLTTYSGNLTSSNVTTGNITAGNITSGNVITGNISATAILLSVIQLANLTQTQVSTITPIDGMMVYNSTYGNVQAYTAHLGRWGNVVLS